MAQKIYRLATCWTVWGSKPGEGEIFRNTPNGPGPTKTPVQCVTCLFPGGKAVVVWRSPPTPVWRRG